MSEYPRGRIGATPVQIVYNGALVSDSNPLPVTGSGGGSGITQLIGDILAGPGSGSQAATLNTILPSKGFLGINHTATDYSTTGTVNNFALTTGWIRFTGAGNLVITGIDSTGIAHGTEIVFYNTSSVASGTITFNNNDGGSSAANRILTGSNIVVSRFDSVRFKYNGAITRWEIATPGNYKWGTSGNREPSGTYYLGTIASGGTSTIQGFINAAQWLNLSNSVGTLDSTTYAAKSVDFKNHELWANGFLRYDWFDGLTYNSSGLKIFDTQNGYVYNGTNDTIIGYLCGSTLYSVYGSGTSVDWDNCYLKNPTDTQLSIDWYARIGVDPNGQTVFSWASTTEFVLTRDLSFASSGGNIRSDTTVGVKFGTAASELISLWGATPIVQPDTSIAAATFSSIGGAAIHENDTFDGYTVGQAIAALRASGHLA